MLLIGFDAAAQPEKFGYAIGSLGRGRIKVTDCGVLKCKAEPDALEARVFPALQHADRALIAIDAPLGWPVTPRPLAVAMQKFRERADYIELDTPGPNALDFHIAYYLGSLAAADPDGFFHVISNDTGFDPLIRHLKTKTIFAARSESIEEMPCFCPAATAPAPANGLDGLVKVAVEDLIKRKAAKPRKVATLRSTVAARLGKEADAHLDAVLDALVRAGHLVIEGEKVIYHLPS